MLIGCIDYEKDFFDINYRENHAVPEQNNACRELPEK